MTDNLLAGLEDFRTHHYSEEPDLMAQLVQHGQDPKYFIVSCIDSRCDPATIFNAAPGIFFAHKAMGAIVRPYHKGTALSTALQFAIKYNKVEKLIVLGHTQCGAVKALAEKLDDEEIQSFINVAKSALEKVKSCCSDHNDILARTEEEVVLQSAENLKTYPAVRDALAAGHVEIKPWIFDIATGHISEHNPATGKFETITNRHYDHHSNESNVRKDHA